MTDKLDDFQYEIQTDVDGFLKVYLGPLYWAYKQDGFDLEALKEELLQLVEPLQYPTPSSIAYADAWTNHLCTHLSICVADWCRSLLHYLYTDFEQSELLQWIAHRFQMPIDELLKTTDSISTLAWLKLWMVHHYPNILPFLFDKAQHKKYRSWKSMDLKKAICYLPVFMLCHLDDVIPLAY